MSKRRIPLKAFLSHHKCGSQWLSGIFLELARAAGLKAWKATNPRDFHYDLKSYTKQLSIDFVAYTNADYKYVGELPLERAVHVVRDPRDVCVSAYFSHLNSHPVDNWKELQKHRKRLQSTSFEEGLLLDMVFNRAYMCDIGNWNYSDQRILEARFEDIVDDQGWRFVQTACSFLGFPQGMCSEAIAEAIRMHSFTSLSGGRQRGETDEHSHYRKGVPGEWKEHFSKRHIDFFQKHYGWVLDATGYNTPGARG